VSADLPICASELQALGQRAVPLVCAHWSWAKSGAGKEPED